MARALAAGLVAAIALAGCGLGGGPSAVDGPVDVYVSLPLSGPRAADGRDAADGARLALEEAGGEVGDLEVRARYLDDAPGSGERNLARVGENAREASEHSATAAYIGELDSGPTRTSAPILNDAGVAQVSPGATAIDLTGPAPGFEDAPDLYRPSGDVTFVRVIPDEEVVEAARKEAPGELVEAALAPQSLPAPGQEFLERFRAEFGREPGPYAAYGYEAMAVVLEAIDRRDAGKELRPSVRDALVKVERLDESVVLGPYSFTTDGDTTLCEVQVYEQPARRSATPRPLRTVCPVTER